MQMDRFIIRHTPHCWCNMPRGDYSTQDEVPTKSIWNQIYFNKCIFASRESTWEMRRVRCRTHRPTSRILLLRLVILQLCCPGSKQPYILYIPEWHFFNQKSWRKSLLKAQQTTGLDAFPKKHPNNWSQAIYKLTPSCDQKECKNTTDPRVECSCQSNCFYVTSQVNQNLALQS